MNSTTPEPGVTRVPIVSRRPRVVRPWTVAALGVLSVSACSTDLVQEGDAGSTQPPTSLAHWSYEGESGPSSWGELDAAYAACGNGTEQSPIALERPASANLDDPQFTYRPGDVTVSDNGHTVVATASDGNTMTLEGRPFTLTQMHFHAPSEHTVDGVQADAEVHLVHKDADGAIAVVGLMVMEGSQPAGSWQPYLDALGVGEGDTVTARLEWPELLPDDVTTLRYAGSLTTPPCSEGVTWLVLDEPVTMSGEQLDAFRSAHAGNNRPLQELGAREILLDPQD